MTAINKITREDVEIFESNVTFWPEDRANGATSDIDFYQDLATKSAIYPGRGTPLGLAYVALKLNGEAGEFAEHVGKAMRDDGLCNGLYMDGGVVQDDGLGPTDVRRELLIKEVGDVLWYLSAACNELGIRLSEAALINLTKLADRTERDALRGSGDNR